MIISNNAIKNRISVVVLAFIIFLTGTYCYMALPRESSPDITIPFVFVKTDYRGVSGTDIENSITIKIEKKLKGLDNVKNITSVSSEGLSRINIEFIPGTDIDKVLPKVKDKVDEAKQELPSDLDSDPSVYEVNFSEMPIVIYTLSGECGARILKKIADDVADDIEAVPGVLEAEVTGGIEREIRVEVDIDKLAYFRIPILALQDAISSENQNTSGGAITLGHGRYLMRIPGEFNSPEELLLLIVATHNGNPVYLKDVAKVIDGNKDITSKSRLDSVDAVNISVKKRVGENIIAVAEKVDKVVKEAQKTFPKNTKLTKLMDQTRDIRLMVADLENNIITGLILVVIVLFLSMGFRNALLVGLAIPFSMLLSFAGLYALDITLNMVVLFSLTLALGMLVDNAIVIIENIYRYIQQGVPKIDAAMKATNEVAWPVIGSTLTTIAAFFPLIFWPGIMGEFMKYLPITLIITLSSSLFVALVINPALCAIFMKAKQIDETDPDTSDKTELAEKIANQGEDPIEIKGFILTWYAKIMKTVLNNKLTTLFSAFAILIILIEIWFLRIGIEKPIEFFPKIDPASVYVNIDPPEGADIEYIDSIVRKAEIAISKFFNNDPAVSPELYKTAMALQKHKTIDEKTFMAPTDINNIEHIYTKTVQNSGGGFSFGSNLPNHIGVQFIDFEDRITSSNDDLNELRERLKNISGAKITVEEEDQGPPTGPPINIEISGDNFETLGKIAEEIKATLSKIPHVKDIRDDYVKGLPSIKVNIDRQRASLFKLTTSAIGFAIKTAYNGLDVSTYYEGDEEYDIVVKLSREDRNVVDILNKLMIPTPTEEIIPLTTIADIEYSGSIGDIVRINHSRVVTVTASVDETEIPGATVRAKAEPILAAFDLPPGYHVKFTGEDESQKEAQEFLSKAFVLALLFIFLILVTLFNSVTQPIIILTSVILSLGGAFLGLFALNLPFGVIMTGVGVISLSGVVVNNAIVLIDYINKLRARGMELTKAIIAGGATRLRPVMLTAITTILGLLPMVTGISYDFHVMALSLTSESTLWWKSMAIVVIFGLMVSTILTLVVVPVLYSLIETSKQKFSKQQLTQF
ncbi:MAG: efflux RND transporter permease subunit [Desulfobacteraceae bacterium]|nr:efflux RND transporter permease subunit [Desulfobacteraceae bacterium]